MKNIICKWSLTLPLSFNTLSFGHLFKRNDLTLITGHEDGGIRVYTMPDCTDATTESVEIESESADAYETKGGPILQQLICDITRLHSNDLITSDSKGLVTFLSAGRILCRKSVSGNCIVCLELYESGMGHMAVIAADSVGNLYSFSHYADFWSLRLCDVKSIAASDRSTEVTCVQCVSLKNRHSQTQTLTLVATRSRHLLFINASGDVVLTLNCPAAVTAMTVGKFVEPLSIVSDEEELASVRGAMDTQLALGCDNGAILLLINYQLCEGEYARLPMAIRQLDRLPDPDLGFNDTLVLLGPSNILSIVQDGEEVAQYLADARITSMIVPKQQQSDDWPDIVIGCDDKTVHGLKITSDEPMIVSSS